MNLIDELPTEVSLNKLLLIDDDPSVVQSLKLLLGSDFRTLSASSVKDGVETFLLWRPSLVILDYKLADGTGMDVLRKIRETDRDTSVVILTAYATQAVVDEAKLLGISDFVSKPFDSLLFRSKVAQLLQKPYQTVTNPFIQRPASPNFSDQAELFFHDTANAITCLSVLSELLQHQVESGNVVDGSSIADEVSLISRNVQYLKFLFEQWKSHKGGAIGQEEVSDTRFAVDMAVVQVTHLLRPTSINLKVEVQVNVGRFLGSHLALAQILVNLLNNAIEAVSSTTGQIVVSATAINRQILITVSDNGNGIPISEQQQIFERHFSTKGDGRGLGLYSCRKAVLSLNGTMEVQSPGKLGGTDFIINLPQV